MEVVLLFTSKESATYDYTRKQVEAACLGVKTDGGKPTVRVIDIAEEPAMAERYNIEALPTIIVGGRRYVGAPSAELLSTCMGVSPEQLKK